MKQSKAKQIHVFQTYTEIQNDTDTDTVECIFVNHFIVHGLFLLAQNMLLELEIRSLVLQHTASFRPPSAP